MSPFMKGALGFLGCAGIFGAAYAIGKHAGREETLKEVELEEKQIAVQAQQEIVTSEQQKDIVPLNDAAKEAMTTGQTIVMQPQTAAERVRKMHGLKNKIFGGTSVIKDLLANPDGKQLTLTVENGDVVARISQKNTA